MDFCTLVNGILPLDEKAMELAQKRWNTLGKPLHSLGRLEELVVQLAGIMGTPMPKVEKKAVIVMAADNGVVKEGVTQTGQEVTKIVTENMTKDKASIRVFARMSGADVFPVDIGIAANVDCPGIIPRKIKMGTENIHEGPAMTREEAVEAILVGADMVRELKQKGYHMFATGEMGIGNTTTSSAICAILLEQSVEKVTGKGAGLTSQDLLHKIEIIKESIILNQVDKNDPIDVLHKVGGLDIAGLVGCFLGAAYYQMPIFIDGFISSVAALLAIKIAPACKSYLFPSHCSNEPAGKMVLDAIGVSPYILANMCLGEGTGAVMGFTIADYALAAYYGIPSFEETAFGTYEELV
ncbi:MAG: nicotinate-nucleotide--dimethylbenzimidazole phosphoribosyltransferase [Lachnospiraceae bacterium]